MAAANPFPGPFAGPVELRSGNLGVDLLMAVARGEPIPPLAARVDRLDYLASLGCRSVEDYVGWWPLEPEPGRVDALPYREHAREAQRRGMRYAVYPWVHAVPPWALEERAFVPFRCVEHDRPTYAPSIWSPFTRWAYRRVYSILRRELGTWLSALYLAGPADYGEVGYPTGMADWVVPYPEGLQHGHEGFWCGDDHARRDFVRFLLRRYATRAEIEEAWGMSVPAEGPIPYPICAECAVGRHDFQRWYTGRLTRFFRWLVRMARGTFSGLPLELRLGHGAELLAFGQDVQDLLGLCKDLRVGVRSTQASLGYLQQKRIATPCHFFGVPLATESIVERSRLELVERVFKDVSCRTEALFEFPEHLQRASDLLPALARLLRGDRPRVDVALFFPTSEHRVQPHHGFPPALLSAAEVLRDYFDYDVLDELAIREGALQGCRVLIMVDGGVIDPRVVAAVRSWIEDGGALLVAGSRPLTSLSGEARADRDLLGDLRSRGALLRRHLTGEPEPVMSLDLGTGGDDYWLSGEWHGPESAHLFWGGELDGRRCRWTGARARIHFPVCPGLGYTLDLDVATLGARGRRQEVHVNGKFLTALPAETVGSVSCPVPAGLLGGERVGTIELACDVFCPRDGGQSPDQRELGVVVRRVCLRAGDVPPGGAAAGEAPDLRAEVGVEDLRARCVRCVDRGGVILCPTLELPTLVAVANRVVHDLPDLLAGARSAPRVDGERDGIWTTLFAKRLLLLNRGARVRIKRVPLSSGVQREVSIPGHAIVEVDLETGRVETVQA
ncbi:MAG: hypothetical protein AB1486_02370 [Planctomycetota bacterium]